MHGKQSVDHAAMQAFSGVTDASIRSRISFPGLKCGTYFAGTATLAPVFGLRPLRDA